MSLIDKKSDDEMVQPLEYIRELTLYLLDPDESLTPDTKERLEKILMFYLSDNMHHNLGVWLNMIMVASDGMINVEKFIESANFHMVRVCLYYVNKDNIINVLYAMHKTVPVSLANAYKLELWGTNNLYFIKYIVMSTLMMLGCWTDTPQLFQWDFENRKKFLMAKHFIIRHSQVSEGLRKHNIDLSKYYKIRKCLFDFVFLKKHTSILLSDILVLYKDSGLMHINMITRYLLLCPERKEFLLKIPELKLEMKNLINFVKQQNVWENDYFYFINETIPVPTPLEMPILMGVTLILCKGQEVTFDVEFKNYLTVQQRLMVKRVVLMLRIFEQPDRKVDETLKLDTTDLDTVFIY